MIDFARITVRAGAGGNGCGSFHHIKGKRYGKANGGNGGNGGNVYIEATTDLNTLEPYRFVKDYQAQNGQNGLSNLRRGANSKDLELKVPVGTKIQLSDTGDHLRGVFQPSPRPHLEGEKTDIRYPISGTRQLTFDLLEDHQRILIASGGQGGRGNAYLRDQFGRRPRTGETSQPGEAYGVTLELKLIADVGLIGLPNAGKSTLLAALTAAHPAIAPYPFTTLEPNLGVLQLSDKSQPVGQLVGLKTDKQKTDQLTLADIPGLIEGASEGRGLGHQFLRHIERTKLLVHLIDISIGYQVPETTFEVKPVQRLENTSKVKNPEPDNLWLTYQAIRNELKTYSKELGRKKEIIVLTKIDLVDPTILTKIQAEFTRHRKKTILVSTVSGKGLEELKNALFRLLR